MSDAGKVQGGGATPQEAFEGFRDAFKAEDPAAMCRWVPPADRDRMILGLYAGARFMAGIDDGIKQPLDALAEKCGIRQPESEDALEDLSDPAKAEALAASMFEGGDVFGFVEGLLAMSDPMEKNPETPPEPKGIAELTIDGDVAHAFLVFEEAEREEVRFVRVEGRWFVEMG